MRIEFHSSPRSTLGVEVELEIVDRQSRELRSAASEVLAVLGEGHPDATHPKVKHELLESTLELVTGICETVSEARADLEATLREVSAVVEARGMALLCSGTHPFSEWSVAALSQCLVEWLDTLMDRGYTLPCPRPWIVRENKWRAARHGMDAEIILDEAGGSGPVREAVKELVEELTPVAERLACADELAGVHRILDHGPSYDRQRRLVAEGASLADVVDSLVEELRTDRPAMPPTRSS